MAGAPVIFVQLMSTILPSVIPPARMEKTVPVRASPLPAVHLVALSAGVAHRSVPEAEIPVTICPAVVQLWPDVTQSAPVWTGGIVGCPVTLLHAMEAIFSAVTALL